MIGVGDVKGILARSVVGAAARQLAEETKIGAAVLHAGLYEVRSAGSGMHIYRLNRITGSLLICRSFN
jgi:hypothetical protein